MRNPKTGRPFRIARGSPSRVSGDRPWPRRCSSYRKSNRPGYAASSRPEPADQTSMGADSNGSRDPWECEAKLQIRSERGLWAISSTDAPFGFARFVGRANVAQPTTYQSLTQRKRSCEVRCVLWAGVSVKTKDPGPKVLVRPDHSGNRIPRLDQGAAGFTVAPEPLRIL